MVKKLLNTILAFTGTVVLVSEGWAAVPSSTLWLLSTQCAHGCGCGKADSGQQPLLHVSRVNLVSLWCTLGPSYCRKEGKGLSKIA